MATELAEHQFEILPSAEAESGVVFGVGAAVSVNEEGFDPGDIDWLTQDSQNTRRGVRAFGRDVLGAGTWAWESHVDQEDVETAVDALEELASAWRPVLLAQEPGAFTALRYRLAGRTRRVFGRPRRWSAPPSNRILNGYVDITHEFDLIDSFIYDDQEQSETILYVSGAEGGGFVLPATMPITTLPSEGVGSGQITIGGRARVYPIIRFNGPWTNPILTTDDWSLAWTGEIGAGEWVEIDTRPWVLTVLREDGSWAEGLGRSSWLEDCWFPAQSSPQISLSGVATGGGASATIRWRNAWNSI